MQTRISTVYFDVFVHNLFLTAALAVHKCLRQSSSLLEACLILKIPFSARALVLLFASFFQVGTPIFLAVFVMIY